MNKISFKDLIQEEVTTTKKEPLWTPIELPVREEKKIELTATKPRKGLKSLLDLNEDIKPIKQSQIKEKIVKTEIIDIPSSEPINNIVYIQEEIIQEDIKQETVVDIEPPQILPSLSDRAVDYISKEVKLEEKADSYQQPESTVDIRSFNDVKKKIQFLQDWIAKVSVSGPGGGAGDIINLDMPTTRVTGDYTITRRDYYVGVNCDVKCNITLPDPSTIVNGREVIVKDESGHAQLTPIKVIGTVDNDPNGFEIRINNGSVTLIYRNGWRII